MAWRPELIVLGPGGIKGFSLLGALMYLEKAGWLDSVQTYVGVSVGAIIGVLLTAGYTTTEIVDYSQSISLFHDLMSLDLSQIKENTGLLSNRQVKDALAQRLTQKFGYVPTLAQFYTFTGIKFVSVTLNIDKGEVEYISYETEPELSVVDAVMLSMNIPFVFYRIKYKGCTYVDGALGNPYPVDVFDDGKTKILGIYIDHETKHDTESISSYFYFILHSVTNRFRKLATQHVSSCCKHLIINLGLTDTLGLNIDNQIKAYLIVQGYEVARTFTLQEEGEEEGT